MSIGDVVKNRIDDLQAERDQLRDLHPAADQRSARVQRVTQQDAPTVVGMTADAFADGPEPEDDETEQPPEHARLG